jgi:gamma-glutamyltranspeptidase/glutathione hydrolase
VEAGVAVRGVVAAGHPLTAAAGADALRAGGNAVDAALAAMLVSFVAEPLLTGLGAGGYMLVAPPGEAPVLLDFFVEAPGRGFDPAARAELEAVEVSFGDAVQAFNVGPASCGVPGTPAGVWAAAERYGTRPLDAPAAAAAALARSGVRITAEQAYVYEILAPITGASPQARERFMPGGTHLREGDVWSDPELADTLERLGTEGPATFYTGDVGTALVAELAGRGGAVTAADLAAYEVVPREPVKVAYRDREVFTNPPPNAGGILLAHALALLHREPAPPGAGALIEAMRRVHRERTPEFVAGLAEPGFAARFLGSRLGSTTHISALDADGWACAVTCSNGEGSAVFVPGTGIHVNNMMGEEDLSPLGYFTHPPGRRLPSMMAPTVVTAGGRPQLVLGSAGSNRIRSALLQVIVNAVDLGMDARSAVDAPRLHDESGTVFAEPGVDLADLEAVGEIVSRFRARNLFFGGCQAVERDPATGVMSGGGDPRRGGAVASA